MYQDSSEVENGDYQILYNYDTIKVPQEAASTIKMTSGGASSSALSSSDSLTRVKLSSRENLIPSSVSTSLAVTNVLTTSSYSEGIRLATPSLSVVTPMACTSIASGIPITAVSLSAADSQPVDGSLIPSGHFSDGSIPSTLTVDTMSKADSAIVNAQEQPIEIGQIVHTSEDGVLDASLVPSSSIDAAVTSMVASDAALTSMVASADCQGVVSNGRKIPSQVIAKLLGDDSLSLAMVKIVNDQEVEGTSHQSQGFNVLTRPGMLVHTKIADNDIANGSNFNHYRQVDIVNLRSSFRSDAEESADCSVVWTCAYCSMAFPSSESVRQHQEKECTESQEMAIATTTTAPAVVESLASPLRQVNDQSYQVDQIRRSSNVKEHDLHEVNDKDVQQLETNYENVFSCAMCGVEFLQSDELFEHHLTHSSQELSSALLKLTKPFKRVKVEKAHPIALSGTKSPKAVFKKKDDSENPGGGEGEEGKKKNDWNKTFASLVKEEITDNPGDTPPQSPVQEDAIEKAKKKRSPKVSSRKSERKKSDKKASKDTKTPRQSKVKGKVVGQGSRDPHACHICNKVLSCRGNLSKHLITHKLEKPFKCNLCGLGFNAKRDQQYHYLMYHTNKRPFNCVVCGKGYVFRHYLMKHMVFHREERKFSCDLCGKQFLTAKCVRRHKKRHKTEKLFECGSCLKAFTVNADLKAHIRKIHRNNKKSGSVKQQISQSLQTLQQKNQVVNGQTVKSKDITEFLLPSGATIPAQLLPADLETTALSDSVTSKEGVFISADSLGSIIPLSEISATEYSGSVEPIGDHTTYVMINNTDEEVPLQNMSAGQGLNIMYTTAAAPTQQVNDLTQRQLDQSDLGHSQHMFVESSLGDGAGQLAEGTLHHHMESQTELQHQAQATHTLPTGTSLDAGHQGNMNVTSGSDEHRGDLTAPSHDRSIVHSSHDVGNGFHLELLQQSIQLELQRTQTSSSNYLGISDR